MNIKDYLEKMKKELSELIHSSDNINSIISSLKEKGYDIELKFLFTILGDESLNEISDESDESESEGEDKTCAEQGRGPPVNAKDKEIKPYDIGFMQSIGIKWNSYGQY